MQLTQISPPYIIPSYSLTGDLLAYLKCGLQYRYQNKGNLPPSKPVQLWFGEFIHAVMEEAYYRWKNRIGPRAFPWDWQSDIRPIELEVARRLEGRGLPPAYGNFCAYDPISNPRCTCPQNASSDHRLLASRRADAAINTWGQHLFPLIAEAESPLQGIRPMPLLGPRRADYYEVTGKADVIGSVQIANAPRGNLILNQIANDRDTQEVISSLTNDKYEIILDYKGTRRPSTLVTSRDNSQFLQRNPGWEYYAWQVRTYAWLRNLQSSSEQVVAGIVLFINELEPSQADMEELQEDVRNNATDIMPTGRDLQLVRSWNKGQKPPSLSTSFREQRSFRLVSVDRAAVTMSLSGFDAVVQDIENAVNMEMSGQGIKGSWRSRMSGNAYTAPERRTCTACDFKYFCPLAPQVGEGTFPPTAP